MGIGLRPSHTVNRSSLIMKWHPSEPVQWLEASYDDHAWDVVDDDANWPSAYDPSTGWAITRTYARDAGGEAIARHRPYSAPMFWFRECDDASGPAVDVVIDRDHDLWCSNCAHGWAHICVHCEENRDHMTGALCPACWSWAYTDDELPALIAATTE